MPLFLIAMVSEQSNFVDNEVSDFKANNNIFCLNYFTNSLGVLWKEAGPLDGAVEVLQELRKLVIMRLRVFITKHLKESP